jgi:hypothetical protein
MSLKSSFVSFGHAIAAGAKYFSNVLIPDAIKVLTQAKQLEPEAEQLIGTLAGPHAQALADTILHVFGNVAEALVPLSVDALAAVTASGVNLKFDLNVINDVRGFATLIEQLLKARGTPAPAPKPVLTQTFRS